MGFIGNGGGIWRPGFMVKTMPSEVDDFVGSLLADGSLGPHAAPPIRTSARAGIAKDWHFLMIVSGGWPT
jgi:hypothetical protein